MVNFQNSQAVAEPAVSWTQIPEQPPDTSTAQRTAPTIGGLPALYLVLIAVVTVAGFLLRWPSFNDSLSGDEVSTFYIVNGHSLGRVLSLIYSGQESTPPLYFLLAWLTKGWFGSAHVAQGIRLVPLITGTAAIPLTFVLGLLTVGRRAALVGATCVACSPFMIVFSTQARTYMLVLFLALVSSICLLRAIDTNRFAWWAGYAAASCAGVYSHYSVVFLLVAQFAWAFFAAPRVRKPLILSNVAAVVAFLPGAAGLPADFRTPNYFTFLVPVNLRDMKDIASRFWIGHTGLPLHQVPGDVAVLLGAVGLGLGAFGAIRVLRHRGPQWWRVPRNVVLIGILAVAPFVLMVAYSWLRVDVMGGGNIIASWPAMALVIGAVVTAPPRPLRVVAVALVVSAYAIGGWKMLSPSVQWGNINGAVGFIERTGQSGDPIVDQPAFSNPLSEVDAALSATPSYTYVPGDTLDRSRSPNGDPHPVIRLQATLAAPPLDEPFKLLAGPRPRGAIWGFPVPTPEQVAQQAMSEAPHGTVFLVSPWRIKAHEWLQHYPNSPMSKFLGTMLAQYHIADEVQFPSDSVYSDGEYVTVFRKDS
jgi:hypothetical protein